MSNPPRRRRHRRALSAAASSHRCRINTARNHTFETTINKYSHACDARTPPTQGGVEEIQAAIENTVGAHTVEMPRVQNSIGLYANISGIKWNYETEGQIMAGWRVPPESGMDGMGTGAKCGGHGGPAVAVVEGFQFDAAGMGDFDVAHKLWDIIDGKARAMVEA